MTKWQQHILYGLCISAVVFGVAGTVVYTAPSPTEPEGHREQTASSASAIEPHEATAPEAKKEMYIRVNDSCSPYFEDACVVVRSGPGEEFDSVAQLRTGVVLKVAEVMPRTDHLWYRIAFDEWLRYPERIGSEWYVAADVVDVFLNDGVKDVFTDASPIATTTKYILIDRSEQTLYAYEGDSLFMKQTISTGLSDTPTPRGTFTVYRKTPTRYMQGPLPGISAQYYDLPGVPWNLYFTEQGGAIHGTYWHDNFGKPWSHGCVNMPSGAAETLYHWATIGTPVYVQE